MIREELEQHDARLLEKPTLVVANKIDLPGAADRLVEFTAARAADGLPVVPISARERTGLDALLAAVAELLPDAETLARPGEPAGVVVHRFDATETGFAVEATEDGFRVNGRRVERLAAQTNFDNEESAERFQRTLARMGVERELIKAGVSNGDTVHIGSIALEWDGQAWA